MSLALGKRKRRQDVAKKQDDASDDSDDNATARALFQRAFEKKFKPLEQSEKPAREKKPAVEDNSDDDDDSDDDEEDNENSGSGSDDNSDDFSGFSGSEEENNAPAKPQIEVIEDRTFRRADPAEEKRLKKQFMSAKIPSTPKYPIPHKPSGAAATVSTDPSAKDEDDSNNLQNDLALQRLLKESHLLDANTFSANGTASCAPEGAARLKALDMRIRDLGGKKSHLDQDRMPIAFRKGMVAKASEREDKRRTEAKENGIILERFGAKTAGGAGAATRGGGRERKKAIGTGGPDIGTYRGATLRLSKNDIKGMEGSKRGGKGGRGGRGGKKKGPTKFGSGF